MSNKTYMIDFNEFGAGTVIDNELQSKGLTVSATTKAGAAKQAMIFDTANPTGEDFDLKTNNLHKALIISEDNDSSDPDDEGDGGKLIFEFTNPAWVKQLTFLDIEEGAKVEFFRADGSKIKEQDIGTTGNGGQKTANFQVDQVSKMVVTLNGSGAVDNLKYAAKEVPQVDFPEIDKDCLVAEYLFEDDNQHHPVANRHYEDTATDLDGVAQNGSTLGSANTINNLDVLDLDGHDDAVLIKADDNFQIGKGALSLEFNQDKHVGSSPDTLISRDSDDLDDGGHLTIQVTHDGRVTVRHQTDSESKHYQTDKNFFDPGDDVRVYYEWDEDGVDGRFVVQNVTTGQGYSEDIDDKLTLDMGPDFNEPFTIGASQKHSSDNQANNLNEYFDGKIDTVRIADLQKGPPPPPLELPELDEDCLVAEYLFEDDNQGQPIANRHYEDTATDFDGVAQNGSTLGSANTINNLDVLDLDGHDDAVLIDADPNFQIGKGAVSLEFNQDQHVGGSPDTLISRDSTNFDDGGHLTIQVTQDGRVTVRHQTEAADFNYQTDANFFDPGDDVRVFYQWDDAGEDGRFIVQNLTTNEEYSEDIDDALTLDMGPNFNEPWTIGASQKFSDDNTANNLNEYFDGQIDTVRIYNLGGAAAQGPDGVVEGTDGDDDIVLGYTGDPEGDTIDAGDAVLAGEGPDDDIVFGRQGDDTIETLAGDDTVFAGPGNDTVDGGAGDDVILGGTGDDDLSGGTGKDAIAGGKGDDTIDGGDNSDVLAGNGGKDTIRGGDGEDVIFGDDPPLASPVREIFKWSDAQDFGNQVDADNFALDTGNTVIAFDYEVSGKAVDTRFETDTQDISELDNTVGSKSSLESVLNGDANSATYMWESGRPLENVEFRINDIDGDGRVVVRAFDEDGNAIEVVLSDAGSGLTLSDTDGVPGNDTAASNDGNYTPDSSPEHSVLVNIPGPVVKWEVLHEQDGNLNTGVNFTDITFDVPLVTGMGTGDHLFGDHGDDTIFGQDGDDTIVGGKGADKLFGGDDADTFQAERDDDGDLVPGSEGTFIGDHVDGGAGGDDCDTLDLTGTAPVGGSLKLIKEGPDSNGNGFDGRVEYFNASGHKVGELTFEEIEKFIICFTPGTAIATPRGEVPVESIRAGDTVITRDNGIQEVSWAGARSLTPTELALKPQLRPVRIRAGSLGDNLPERDMIVSPQHRVLMANDKTQLYFGEREVIAAASHLVGLPGVERLGVEEPVTYAHFLCEQHEIVLSNGAWTETFQPGDYTMGAMEEGARNEILELFPELAEDGALASFPTVRRSLKRYEAMLLSVN